MPPSLRVLISSSSAYPPTIPISVNSSTPTKISTGTFEGEVSVYVKDFHGEHAGGDGSGYFKTRSSMTYGIVVRGRYLDGPDGDDVVFGNVFERPIRDSLPWGTSVAVKFMNYVDPTMELDIYADKPWALSPALACMNNLSLTTTRSDTHEAYIKEDTQTFLKAEGVEDEKTEIANRRKHFGKQSNRKETSLQGVEVGMEFANGLLDFNTLSATLPPPFHLSVPLLKYWDGQPVTYVCRRRPKDGASPVTAEGVYWSVGFEIVDEDAKKELEKRGGKVLELSEQSTGKASTKAEDKSGKEKKEEDKEEVSDDVD